MEKEIRQYQVELRACGDEKKRMVEGRAIPFNVFSPDREGFRELILPEAVEGVIEKSDIKFLYNHDASKGFLARNKKGKGSLKIDVREDGVYFTFPVKNDNLSNYVYERLENGELDEMSWAFTIEKDTWEKQEDGVWNRTISKFDTLYDFSVVDNSYYGIEGAVKCARFAEIQEEERKAIEAAKAEAEKAEQEKREAEEKAAEEARQAAIKEAHEKLVEEYGKFMK